MTAIHKLQAHIIFVTKYRRKILTDQIRSDMTIIFNQICLENNSELLECNGEKDHIHLLIAYPPKLAISSIVAKLKGRSSYELRNKYTLKEMVRCHLWSPSYFAASCGGAPLEIIKRYIKNQTV